MTLNGKTIPLPSEFTTPPAWTSQTCRGSIGSRLRRYVAGDCMRWSSKAKRWPRPGLAVAPPCRRDLCEASQAMPRRFHGRPLTTLPSVELEARAETYPLAETFVISRDSSDESESVIVELRHNGLTGYGEGAPIERYYEDGAGAVEFLHTCRGAL